MRQACPVRLRMKAPAEGSGAAGQAAGSERAGPQIPHSLENSFAWWFPLNLMIESTHTHWMCNAKQSRQRRLSAAKGTQASKEGFDFGSISVIVPFYAGETGDSTLCPDFVPGCILTIFRVNCIINRSYQSNLILPGIRSGIRGRTAAKWSVL